MRSFLDLFRAGRDRRPKSKATRLTPVAEGLESRNLLARVGGILANWSGIFADPVGLAGPISGLGTSTVEFGTPIPGAVQSRLSFVGDRFPTPIRVRNHNANSGVEVGRFTFANTPLSAPPLSQISLQVTISSDVGQRTVRLPFQVNATPNDPDTIRLVGKPIVRLIRGFAVQIVGFGIPNPGGGRVSLSNQLTVAEDSTATVSLIGKVIRV